MISDVLFEAAEEIRRYQRERPEVYDKDRAVIDALLERMDSLCAYYDRTPGARRH